MSKYAELDKKIILMLNAMPTPIFDIWLKFRDEVKDITVIDRRMQHLKNKGLIHNITGAGWALTKHV